jgi:hypothetical protein
MDTILDNESLMELRKVTTVIAEANQISCLYGTGDLYLQWLGFNFEHVTHFVRMITSILKTSLYTLVTLENYAWCSLKPQVTLRKNITVWKFASVYTVHTLISVGIIIQMTNTKHQNIHTTQRLSAINSSLQSLVF